MNILCQVWSLCEKYESHLLVAKSGWMLKINFAAFGERCQGEFIFFRKSKIKRAKIYWKKNEIRKKYGKNWFFFQYKLMQHNRLFDVTHFIFQ